MSKLPTFRLFGEGNYAVEKEIQPELPIREWVDLTRSEKVVAIQQLLNSGWLDEHSEEVLSTISYMNYHFLRQLPGKHLHAIEPGNSYSDRHYSIKYTQMKAANKDFQVILLEETSNLLVYRMLSVFSGAQIDRTYYNWAKENKDKEKRKEVLLT